MKDTTKKKLVRWMWILSMTPVAIAAIMLILTA